MAAKEPVRLAMLILSVLYGAISYGETYIVPIWANALPASDGTWWTQITATNPNSFPVSFRVTDVFPLQTAECAECSGRSFEVTIPPYETLPIHPHAGTPGRRLVAGAFEVQASARINIHLVAYRPGFSEIRQRLDVANRWLTAGAHRVSSVELGGYRWRMNAIIVNPTNAPLEVTVRSGGPAESDVRASVAPHSMAVVRVPPPVLVFPATFPPPHIRVDIESTGQFLVSISSIGEDWAVFSLADEALPP